MKLKALKEFRFGDRILSIGETFETVTPSHARLLIMLKRASEYSEEAPVQDIPKPKKRAKKTLAA